MRIIEESVFAVIVSAVIFAAGIISLVIIGFDLKNIAAVIVGFIWGAILPILAWGFRYKNKYRINITRFLRLYDPARGSPDYEKDGKRYYGSRAGLPDIESLLSIEDLKSVEILSITSYLLVLTYRDKIDEALGRGVKFTFLVLDPNDETSVRAQTENYRKRDIKEQIETTISDLESLKNSGGDITIHKYSGMIGNGIMILRMKDTNYDWIKVENFSSAKDANSRLSRAWYYRQDKEAFTTYCKELERRKPRSY